MAGRSESIECGSHQYYITECYVWKEGCPGTCDYAKKIQGIQEDEKIMQFNRKIFGNLNQVGIEFI
jgi:hypothetical protein